MVARWPGSSHDANIFEASNIKQRLEGHEFGNGVLLGDSAYPLREYLLTPIAHPHDNIEDLFNEAQIRTRNVVERTFGIWKRRFPCLSTGLRCKLPLAQDIIIATAVLHNIARNNRIDENEVLLANDNIVNGNNIEHIVIEENNNRDNNFHRAAFFNYFRTL